MISIQVRTGEEPGTWFEQSMCTSLRYMSHNLHPRDEIGYVAVRIIPIMISGFICVFVIVVFWLKYGQFGAETERMPGLAKIMEDKTLF